MINKTIDKINEKWIYVISDLFSKASIYFLTLVFSYIVLPKYFGNFSLFNSLVTVFFVLASLNLTNSYIMKVKSDKNCDFTKVLSTIITFIIIINIVFLLFGGLILLLDISVYSISPIIIFLSLATAVLNCNYELLLTVLVAEKEKKKYLVIGISFSIILIVLSLFLFFCFKKLNIYSIIITKMLLLAIFSGYSLHYMKKKYDIKFNIDKNILKNALKFSVPLILHSLSAFILNYIDKFMLNDLENITATAVYSFSYNLASVLMVVSIAINKAVVPKFYALKAENNDAGIEKIITKNLKSMCALFALFIIAVGFIYPIFPTAYNNTISIFILLTYNYLIFYGYNIYSNYLYYRGDTSKIFTNTLISGIINLVLNCFLIKKYSSLGASISTIISYIALLLLYYISVRKTEKTYYPLRFLCKYFAISGLFAVLYCISYKYLICRIIFILIIITIGILYMKKDMKIKKIKRGKI